MPQPNSANLVRPRTKIPDTHRPPIPRPRSTNSFIILSLCGACMFLFILSVCLITSLVLVGRNLSTASTMTASLLLPPSSVDMNEEFANGELPENNTSQAILDTLSWRLPTGTQPTLYELLMHPDLETQTFTGHVDIHLHVELPRPFIVLHASELSITETMLEQVVGEDQTKELDITNTFLYPKYENYVVEVEKPLDIGEYVLRLTFNGSLSARLIGFYQSTHFNTENPVARSIATSKFEPTYARLAYPCFDEPHLKARFQISIIRPMGDNYTAYSNMNEESFIENPLNGTVQVNFATSVPMSTYLTAFIIGDFKHKQLIINTTQGNDILLRLFATPDQLDKLDWALEAGAKLTQYYIDYFQIPYPLPKLDMVAIPDFVSGAMENWGLITFRETKLLYDSKTGSNKNLQEIATVVAHELAHMWFGNLVTMKWWEHIWLSEGFARHMQYKSVNAVYPEWNMMDAFLIKTMHGVLRFDSTLSSHPIVQVAESPHQISELFDTISYNKAGCIIRMLEDFVGSEVFRNGVTNYLKAHEYESAVTEHLLDEFELLNSGFDVKYIMSTWTSQMGYPVVNVEQISPTQYKLTQKRFLLNPSNEKNILNNSEFNYRYYIPITYQIDGGTIERSWFKNDDIELTLPEVGAHKWIKLNKNQTGFYRVNYPRNMWQALIDGLADNINAFSIADRAHLLNDAFSLAEAQHIKYDIALELTRFLANETNYVPWSAATVNIFKIQRLLYYTELHARFDKYGQDLIAATYNRLRWNRSSDVLEQQLIANTIEIACTFGLQSCLDDVKVKFLQWMEHPHEMPHADVSQYVYSYGIKVYATEAQWFKILDLYTFETDATQKNKLRIALAQVQNPWLLRRFIDLAWNESIVRGQDYFECMTKIAGNTIGQSLVWDFIRENYKNLIIRFGLNNRGIGKLIQAATNQFCTQSKLEEIHSFFSKHPDAGASVYARKLTIETVKNNIEWLRENVKIIQEWLNKNNY